MIRRLIIEAILFAFPFIVYFGGRALARALKPGVVLPDYARRMPHLTLAGAALAVAGFVIAWALEPRHVDETYVPAHMENGEFKPGGFSAAPPAPDAPVLTPMQKAAQERDEEAAGARQPKP